MLYLRIEKKYTHIMGGLSDTMTRALIAAFTVMVPGFWFAKSQMKKKAEGLMSAPSTARQGQSLHHRADAWDGSKKFISKDGRRIPTGLLNLLFDFCRVHNIQYQVTEDTRSFLSYDPALIQLSGITTREGISKPFELHPFQQEVIQVMAEQGNGVILVGTGGGKTEIAAGLIRKLQTPITLFLTHRNLLSSQTIKRLEKRLELPIGFIGGDVCDIQQVTVGMVPTLANRIEDGDVTINSYLRTVQLAIGDEIHLGTADTWMSVFKAIPTSNLYGLSGTPWKNSVVDDMKLMAEIGPEIFKVPTKWLIDNGYLTPPVIKVVPFKHAAHDGTYAEAYKECVVNNVARHGLIKRIVDLAPDKQTLILVTEIEHGKQVFETITKSLKGKAKRGLVENINSKMKKDKISDILERFAKKEIRVLISTPLLDVGVDIPTIDRMILCNGAGKAITAILQRIGRSLRLADGKVEAEIFDIADIESNYLLGHFNDRMAIYTDENQQFKIELLDILNQFPQQKLNL